MLKQQIERLSRFQHATARTNLHAYLHNQCLVLRIPFQVKVMSLSSYSFTFLFFQVSAEFRPFGHYPCRADLIRTTSHQRWGCAREWAASKCNEKKGHPKWASYRYSNFSESCHCDHIWIVVNLHIFHGTPTIPKPSWQIWIRCILKYSLNINRLNSIYQH